MQRGASTVIDLTMQADDPPATAGAGDPVVSMLTLENTQIMSMQMQAKAQSLANVNSFMLIMSSLNPAWKSDDQLRAQTEEMAKLAFFG